MRGTVKYFASRGYGFLKPDTGGPDIFVHISQIADERYSNVGPPRGAVVEFEVEPAERGPQAVGVRVIAEPDEAAR